MVRMAILDSQGRLFGKVSILDFGAGLVILMVLVGIFLFPGTGGSVAQLGVETKPVELDVIARGIGVSDPKAFITSIESGKTTNLLIRNQPHGQVNVLAVKPLPRSVSVPQPDGSVKAMKDPRPELDYSTDIMVTLGGEAQITKTGPVLGSNKIKIGNLVELEGTTYNFNASIVDIRIK
jgi:hypothetical protein